MPTDSKETQRPPAPQAGKEPPPPPGSRSGFWDRTSYGGIVWNEGGTPPGQTPPAKAPPHL